MFELDLAIAAARAAGELIGRAFGVQHEAEHKGRIDLVTAYDRRSEALIRDMLLPGLPGSVFLGEESGGGLLGSTEQPCWVVDPIDGTTNFARGYPFFAVSIGLVEAGVRRLGVVYNPVLDELFTGVRGEGARLNGAPIRVSAAGEIDSALVASGFPYDVGETDADNSREWRAVTRRALSMRCDGCASLDLCYVAAGRLDAYWELDIEPWDVAAGSLIVEEAGGRVSRVDGSAWRLGNRGIAATNGRIHDSMIALFGCGWRVSPGD
jgi:myo-inositol-1(or 4)-monophosphatase